MNQTFLDLQDPLDAATYLDGANNWIEKDKRVAEIFAANGFRPAWLDVLEKRGSN